MQSCRVGECASSNEVFAMLAIYFAIKGSICYRNVYIAFVAITCVHTSSMIGFIYGIYAIKCSACYININIFLCCVLADGQSCSIYGVSITTITC